MTDKLLTLNTGAKIPAIGLGTWQSAPDEVRKAVLHAIKVGYRHIDCAYVYGNEEEVGAALKEAFDTGLVKRSDLFITTKLWCTWHSRAEAALDTSLKLLGLDYVDLYLMHWPIPMNPNGNHPNIPKLPDGSRDLDKSWSYVKTWEALEKLPATGKTRAVGVSNFSVKYLEELLKTAKIVPAANQIENHPLLPQDDVKEFCDKHGIILQAYSPLGSTGSPLFQDEGVKAVAEKRGVTPGTVLLSYHVSKGNVALPKSVTPSRIEENTKIVELTQEELSALADIPKKYGVKRYIAPDFGVDLQWPDKPFKAAA